jgi:predicted enzyme related to lactoylglutathione lyase
MSPGDQPAVGTIVWTDLTVDDADEIREFYTRVVGWGSAPVDMGGYDDFNMSQPATGDAVAGICHARGTNADLPAQWLVYVTVEDVDASAARCEELGGSLLVRPRGMGEHGRFCVIRDPAGAVAALFEPA